MGGLRLLGTFIAATGCVAGCAGVGAAPEPAVGGLRQVDYVVECDRCDIYYTAAGGVLRPAGVKERRWQHSERIAAGRALAMLVVRTLDEADRIRVVTISVDLDLRAEAMLPGLGITGEVELAAPLQFRPPLRAR